MSTVSNKHVGLASEDMLPPIDKIHRAALQAHLDTIAWSPEVLSYETLASIVDDYLTLPENTDGGILRSVLEPGDPFLSDSFLRRIAFDAMQEGVPHAEQFRSLAQCIMRMDGRQRVELLARIKSTLLERFKEKESPQSALERMTKQRDIARNFLLELQKKTYHQPDSDSYEYCAGCGRSPYKKPAHTHDCLVVRFEKVLEETSDESLLKDK